MELSTPWQLGPLKCSALFYIYFKSYYLRVFRRTCVSAWPCATACLAVSHMITSSARTHRLTCSSPWWLASSCGRHDPSSLQPRDTLLNRPRKTRWMLKIRVTAFPLDPGLVEGVPHWALNPSACSYGHTSFGPDRHVALCCLVDCIRIWVEAPLSIVTVPQAFSLTTMLHCVDWWNAWGIWVEAPLSIVTVPQAFSLTTMLHCVDWWNAWGISPPIPVEWPS